MRPWRANDLSFNETKHAWGNGRIIECAKREAGYEDFTWEGKRKKNSTENKNTKRSRKLRKSESELCERTLPADFFNHLFLCSHYFSFFPKSTSGSWPFHGADVVFEGSFLPMEKTQRIRSAPKRRVKKKSEEKNYKKRILDGKNRYLNNFYSRFNREIDKSYYQEKSKKFKSLNLSVKTAGKVQISYCLCPK